MSEHAATAHEHPNYIKIWGILLVLLCISIAGPVPRDQGRHADHGVRHRDREGVHGREELHAPEHRAAVRDLPDHDDARVRAALLRRHLPRRDEVGRRQLGEAEGGAGVVARYAPRRPPRITPSESGDGALERALRVITDPRPRPVLPSAVLGDADLRQHRGDAVRGPDQRVPDPARERRRRVASAGPAAASARGDRDQHARAARERIHALARAPRVRRFARARAASAHDRDGARRVLRAVPGLRVGDDDRAGPHAHLEQPRQLLLSDRGAARARTWWPGSRCSRGRGGGCAAASSPAAASARRRCSGSSSSVSGRSSTFWSTHESHSRSSLALRVVRDRRASRRRVGVLGVLRGRRREPQGVPVHDRALERAPARDDRRARLVGLAHARETPTRADSRSVVALRSGPVSLGGRGCDRRYLAGSIAKNRASSERVCGGDSTQIGCLAVYGATMRVARPPSP